MEELEKQLKQQIIEVLNLEDMSPEDIEGDAPLFGDGLGLDSRNITASSCPTLRKEKPFSNPYTRWPATSPPIAQNNPTQRRT